MPFVITVDESPPHKWATAVAACQLENADDAVLVHFTRMIRECYGEPEIMNRAAAYNSEPEISATFDLQAIQTAIRRSLPDPAQEGNKPPQLANYRSEPAEIVARCALQAAHQITYPPAPQAGKLNANQPIFGFDGWGILPPDGVLLLYQVKGTEDETRPPGVADTLIQECVRIPTQMDEICRTLCAVVSLLERGSQIEQSVLTMLETLGRNQLPPIVVAPVIVRGTLAASMDDFASFKAAFTPPRTLSARGMCVSIGVPLADFGTRVLTTARTS